MDESQIKADVNRNITLNRLADRHFTINESSCVADIDYDLENEILTVVYQQRGTYKYFSVSLDTFVDFAQAGSRGKYLNLYIRTNFSYERIS